VSQYSDRYLTLSTSVADALKVGPFVFLLGLDFMADVITCIHFLAVLFMLLAVGYLEVKYTGNTTVLPPFPVDFPFG
jgi:hypothetical protein